MIKAQNEWMEASTHLYVVDKVGREKVPSGYGEDLHGSLRHPCRSFFRRHYVAVFSQKPLVSASEERCLRRATGSFF